MTFKVVFYSALVFLTSAIGGLVPIVITRAGEDHLKIFVSLGAGILVGMAFCHMIPEAAELLPHYFGYWVLLGFLILLVMERFVMVHACEESHCDYHTIGTTAFVGLTIHGLIEGMALASSLLVSNIGILVLTGILAHKAPAGFALSSILKLAGRSKRQILLFIFGVSLSVPAGCFLAYWILKSDTLHGAAGALLSASSGTFIYIAACDLLPELHRGDHEKFRRLAAFLIGIVISGISGILIGH